MPRIGHTAVVAALIALGASSLFAQVRYLKQEPGTWKPWHMTVSSDGRRTVKATAPELKAFEAELVKFREILRAAPSAAQPRGYSVEAWGYLASMNAPGQPDVRTLPIPGGVDFGAFPIFEYERRGKTVREDTGETALLLFMVNDITAGIVGKPGPPEWSPLDLGVFTQPKATGQRAGWPLFGDIIVMTKRTGSPWVPVPLAEALAIDRKAAQARRDEAAEVVEKFRQELAKILDPARRAARRAENERNAPTMPDPKAFLAQMAEVERISERATRAELEPSGGSARRLAEADRALAKVDQRIAALTDADGAAPSCFATAGATPETRITRGPAAGCVPLVRSNWDFFDHALPRSAPQIVVVTQARRCYEDAEPTTLVSGCPANKALLESIDRQKVLDWLN
jgi:hypothetical protein